MRYTGFGFGARVHATFVGAGVAALFATAVLSAPVVAADQSSTSAQVTDAIGPHTHQVHGVVKGTPGSGATSFVVTTQRHGDVTVTVSNSTSTAATNTGHGHGKGQGNAQAQASQGAAVSDLKDGTRVVVQGHTSSDGNTFVARRIHLLPAGNADDQAALRRRHRRANGECRGHDLGRIERQQRQHHAHDQPN
jgi:hypothetical protein